MHEFELGVWKSLFVHLIRILEAEDRLSKSSKVDELDRRSVYSWKRLKDVLSKTYLYQISSHTDICSRDRSKV